MPRTLRRALLALAIATTLAVLTVGVTAWRVASYDVTWEAPFADAAIVLGASAYHKNPSPVFRERIRHAVNLYQSGRVSRLIFTGGRAPGSEFSEAAVARRFAIRAGVPPEDILIEELSMTTLGNLY